MTFFLIFDTIIIGDILMLEVALKFLKEINSHNYEAYIIGGFVRDYLLGFESVDIDVATNATPKQIKEIFEDSCLSNEDYGSVSVIMKGVRFEITTFRKELTYVNNRKPDQIEYIDDLYQDLTRRDFVINTLCMDQDGNIIDYLGGKKDLDKKIIRTVGDAYQKFSEDTLRILRAVRFATILNFSLDDDVKNAIVKTKHLLKNLSYYRKKCELEKIFTSLNYKNGIKLLLELGMEKELEISNLSRVLESETISLIGIWSLLDVTKKYPFNKNELNLIESVHKVMNLNNLDPMVLYQYGLYVNSVAAEIKGIDIKDITESYDELVIKSRSDIDINSLMIMKILHKGEGAYLKKIYEDLEREILYRRLENNQKKISQYILKNYG